MARSEPSDPSSGPSGAGRRGRRRIVAATLVVLLAGVVVADGLGVQTGFLPRSLGLPSLGLPGWLDPSGQNPDPAVDTAAEQAAAARAVPPPALGEPDAVTPAEKHQAGLVDAEDRRLSMLVSDGHSRRVPYIVAGTGQSLATEVLTPRPQPYDLPDLLRLGAAHRLPDGAWLLERSLLVVRGAQLTIHAPGVTVRLVSGPHGIASVIAFKTAVTLEGDPGAPLAISSWDPDAARPDTDTSDGRAYLRAVGSRMDLTQVRLSDLGFWSGRTGGLAWTGTGTDPATGSITGSVVERCHFGLYTRRATALAVTDTVLRGSDVDGLLARRDTTGLTATHLTAAGNGRNGVAIGDGAARVTLTGVVATGNRINGIRIDGQSHTPRTPPPPATPTPPAGAPDALGAGYTVTGATVADNHDVGILISNADGVTVRDSTISGGRDGITLHAVTGTPQITGDTVNVAEFAIAVRAGRPGSVATVAGNRIGTAQTGIQIVDAAAAVHANAVTAATRYGISLVGRVDATTVTTNTLSGHGLGALDNVRVTAGVTPAVDSNDDSGWTRDIDYLLYSRDYTVAHPLVLLWALILLIPLTARLRSRRRRHTPGGQHRHPYRRGTPANAVAETDTLTAVHPHVPDPRSAPRGSDATTMLPVTRVTVVSQVRDPGPVPTDPRPDRDIRR